MLQEKKLAISVLLLFSLFFLGFSLFFNFPAINSYFLFADQAVYFAMAQSIAYDGDLEFTKKDLARYYQDFPSGPQGIFLKRGKDNKIFYAKSFSYSLFASPFVKIFGYNGIFVFHAILLVLVLFSGFAYLSLFNRPKISLFSTLTFLFASVAGVYYLWISPDFFNLSLVFLIVFLWVYKLRHKEEGNLEEKKSKFQAFLLSDWTDYLASFLAGIAVFSKPPNAVLMGPLVLLALVRKKYFKSLLMILLFVLTLSLFFGTNYLLTSDWNFMGGERKIFYGTAGAFPFEKENITFDSTGYPMTSEAYFGRFLIPAKFFFYNFFYYFFGRFTGISWYFFPAFLALCLFFFGKRRLYQCLILAALLGEIIIYIVLMPTNYGGGGGSLANRYFLNIYPFFFFLPSLKKTKKEIFLIWIMAAIFISQILVSPFRSSASPATHVKKFPFKILPVEMTLINELATNTNPNAFRVPFGTPPNDGYMHFLDDNFNPKQEPTGVWTRGPYTAEMILKTYFPAKEIIVHLTNNRRMSNEIKVRVEGKTKKITLGPKQKGTLAFPVGKGFKMKEIHLYKIKIKASKGSIPYYEEEASKERRFLGVFFELEIVPKV